MKSEKISKIEARHALLAEQASKNIQQLYDDLQLGGPPSSKIKFPRGVIRTSESQRKRFSFITAPTLRSNCAYNIALADIQNWLLCRTDIIGLGRRLVLKNQFILLATIVESATKHILKGIFGGNFKERLEFLTLHNIIDKATEQTLCEVWDIRTNIHLFMMEISELEEPKYSDTMLIKGAAAFRKLIDVLNTQSAQIRKLNNYVNPISKNKTKVVHQGKGSSTTSQNGSSKAPLSTNKTSASSKASTTHKSLNGTQKKGTSKVVKLTDFP